MDLPDWPPCTFSIVESGHGHRLPAHAGQVTIGEIVNIIDRCVWFGCDFESRTVMCTFFMPNPRTAWKIEAILKAHKGKYLLSIGPIRIPPDLPRRAKYLKLSGVENSKK